ncbi:major facilitator superfamily domain-containing protein [Halenospora varia]|nr:major facilitator superfamily domain-containing protein [Halenospora varia]
MTSENNPKVSEDPIELLKVDIAHVEDHNDSSSEQDEENKRIERRLKWKLDLFILPTLSLVYFLASMGRSDLANAEVAGMSKELKLTPHDYSNAASIFLAGYLIFQLPGTLLIRKIGPPTQFAATMFLWGTLTLLTVTIKNYASLMAIRFLIGTCEAFIQGAVFYLSFWYTYTEIATRGAIFYSTATLAGAFNGLIAYGIVESLDGAKGWRAWRWIFLIEGILPMAMSILVILVLPQSPQKTRKLFTEREKEIVIRRSLQAHNHAESKLDYKKIYKPLLSLSFWLMVGMACATHFCTSSLGNFLPIIIHGFGYTSVNAQLFSAIVYACAFVGVLFWARLADKTQQRGLVIAASSGVSIIGYALLLALTDKKVRFAATCVVVFGVFPNIILVLAWTMTNVVGYTER